MRKHHRSLHKEYLRVVPSCGCFFIRPKSRSENILKAVRKGFVQSGNTELKVWGGTAAMLRWADTKSFHSIGERS